MTFHLTIAVLLFSVVIPACSVLFPSYPTPINRPLPAEAINCNDPEWPWDGAGPIVVAVSLSGGGKRAAAYAHGVMSGLAEIPLNLPNGSHSTLLNEIDYLTGVSGGATAATYYALTRGQKMRGNTFERFLYDNTELSIVGRALNPINWFTSSAVLQAGYFGKVLYDNKTFGDLPRWPYLMVGATDLSRGRPFNFTRAQFSCIGSDLSQYPLGHAVGASSAFPLLIGTMPLTNFNPNRTIGPYLNLADGGLVDNLARNNVQILLERGYLIGNIQNTFRTRARAFIFIEVDGSSHIAEGFEDSATSPGLFGRVSRSFDVVFEQQVKNLRGQLTGLIIPTCDTLGVDCIILNISLKYARDDAKKRLLHIPTRWSLDKQDIDLLIQAGRDALIDNSERINDIQRVFSLPN